MVTKTRSKQIAPAKQMSVYEKDMTSALLVAEKMKISKFTDVMEAADFLFEVKKTADKIDEEKTKILKPFLEGAKLMRKLFAPVEGKYSDAEKIVKTKILDWHASEWSKGNTPDNKTSGLNGTVTVVERKRVEVEDANAIPREFCVPDPEKIEHALKAGIKVPGASLVPEYVIAAGKN